ncbi:hypothetical protein FVA81_24060 [Rhizobium sp. WL3]|uniref:hypothetical protein n=1 Tax=Rhizobium sp. WL3 TaxID=2603277 RepID=UPI0011C1FBB7|nr:hypothetical protein [Rhizobium sp. WL3]QEE47491.1 hypothetical protein FVA81_24060 [Rhizobium sp. WL3]
MVGALGQSQGQKWEAEKAKRAAEVGRVRADQIDATYRDELSSTISNIRSIRASSGASMNSPTGMAIEADQQRISDRDRKIDVGNQRMQANQDEEDAKFRKSAARMALFGGAVKSLAYFGS